MGTKKTTSSLRGAGGLVAKKEAASTRVHQEKQEEEVVDDQDPSITKHEEDFIKDVVIMSSPKQIRKENNICYSYAWRDMVGDDCGDYANNPHWCEVARYYPDQRGRHAGQMCCACNGGCKDRVWYGNCADYRGEYYRKCRWHGHEIARENCCYCGGGDRLF